MVKIRKMVIVGLVIVSVLTSFGFCFDEEDPNPPHCIAKPSVYFIGK